MESIRFFLDYWKNISPKESRRIQRVTFVMVIMGVAAGGISTSLLATINAILNGEGAVDATVLWRFIGLVLLLPVAKFLGEASINWLFVPLTVDLMSRFMRSFMAMPIGEIDRHGVDKFYTILDVDLRLIYNALRALVLIVVQGSVILSCLVYIAWLSWFVFGWTLLFLIIGLLLNNWVHQIAARYLWRGREAYGNVINYFGTLARDHKQFKLHHKRRQAFFRELAEPQLETMTKENLTGTNLFNLGESMTAVLYFILVGSIIFVSLLWFEIPREVMSGVALALMFMLAPLETVVNNLDQVIRGNISVKKLQQAGVNLFDGESEVDFYDKHEPMPTWKEIKLEGVSHHYGKPGDAPNPHDFVLGPIDLILRPGEVTIIAGGNGCGKTTLAKIICGLYSPVSGRIIFNDLEIDDKNRDRYRQIFSAVFVNFHLFDRLLGFDHIPDLDSRARSYLERLEIGDKLDVQDGKLSTTSLSQGQRKRLALMITYLEDRPCYVFDEWTANQDPMFRDFFYREIVPDLKARGKAVLIITHDDTYFHAGDRIVKMDMGKIEADMPSDRLLQGKASSAVESSEASS